VDMQGVAEEEFRGAMTRAVLVNPCKPAVVLIIELGSSRYARFLYVMQRAICFIVIIWQILKCKF